MQRIKQHYCWVKAHPSAPSGHADDTAPAQPLSTAGSNAASMPLYWSEGGALLSQAQALTRPPSPRDRLKFRWGPKSASPPAQGTAEGPEPTAPPDDEVAWGPKSPAPPEDDVAWGPKAPPPLGDEEVAWGPKSAPPVGEVKSFAALQSAMAATVDVDGGAEAPAQRADARKPYWGPKAAGMEFAGATLMGGWQFEHASVGQGPDGIRMSFSVVLGERQRALGWLADTEGQAWSADALAISLVCFAAVGDF